VTFSKDCGRAVSLLAVLPLILSAQSARDNVIPLKNWDTPLYWHPSPTERSAAKPVPQLQPVDDVPLTPLTFVGMTPCRLVDTRGAAVGFDGNAPFSGGPGPIAASATVPFPVLTYNMNTTPTPCGAIPLVAAAYSLNVTIIPVTTLGSVYVEVWPDGTPEPDISTLNDPEATVVANSVIVAAGTPNGGVNVFNYGPGAINVIIDMNGYFIGPTSLSGNTGLGAETLVNNTSGYDNMASGNFALSSNTGGWYDVANGAFALQANTTGNNNTASGEAALHGNTQGSYNTASGASALSGNVIGSNNTAVGFEALLANIVSDNTAVGYQALMSNIAGTGDTATGYQALLNNISSSNTAIGYQALQNNTGGAANTASGYQALAANIIGTGNTATGTGALQANTGYYNTAIGGDALQTNTMGTNNIAVGSGAGVNQPNTNNDSIYIGSIGTTADLSGSIQIGTQAPETTGTIRIGTAQAGGTYIAGIYGTVFGGGMEVFVNNNGQLTTLQSSSRFKEQITDMGDSSSKLLQLRPVNFYYKPEFDDGSRQLQYGLIAEDVAKVYPEMVAYANDGQVLSIKYQLLAPMLLNELQKQAAQNLQQAQDLRSLEARLAALEAGFASGSPAGPQPVH
jgi:hypothetical protein